jgi:hypothetical protein
VSSFIFLPNVKEHAPPPAGAHSETGVEVQTAPDSADKAAGGGCRDSSCSLSSFLRDARNCADVLRCEMQERSGFRDVWEKIEPHVKEEILDHWGGLIAAAFHRAVSRTSATPER